jgi:hypothetical protein
MKTLNLILSVAVIMAMVSCKKSIKTPELPDAPNRCQVTIVEHLYTNNNKVVTDSYYYTYNIGLRISRIDYRKPQSNEFETYTYASNKVTWKGVGGDTEVYNLDASGKIISAIQGSDVLNFKYNGDDQMIEAAIRNDIETFTYLNGNLSSASYNSTPWSAFTYGNERPSNQIVYSWVYSDKFLDFDEISNRVIPYIGKTSNNLPTRIITNPGTRDQITFDYNYTRDADGNITSAKVSVTEGGVKTNEEYKFTYNCN